MYVSLSVGMRGANRNPNPCTDLHKTLWARPCLSKEGFGADLTPAPSPARAWGVKPFKLKDTFLKKKMFSKLQINSDSAGYPC